MSHDREYLGRVAYEAHWLGSKYGKMAVWKDLNDGQKEHWCKVAEAVAAAAPAVSPLTGKQSKSRMEFVAGLLFQEANNEVQRQIDAYHAGDPSPRHTEQASRLVGELIAAARPDSRAYVVTVQVEKMVPVLAAALAAAEEGRPVQ